MPPATIMQAQIEALQATLRKMHADPIAASGIDQNDPEDLAAARDFIAQLGPSIDALIEEIAVQCGLWVGDDGKRYTHQVSDVFDDLGGEINCQIEEVSEEAAIRQQRRIQSERLGARQLGVGGSR